MATYNIFTSQTPVGTNSNDSSPYTLGTTWYTTQNGGRVTGIRWYFPTTLPSGTVVGGLFQQTSEFAGTLLASESFSSPVAGTWNTVTFATPVAISANTMYVAAIYTPDRYVGTSNVFTSSGITNGPLIAPHDGSDPLGLGSTRNGRFHSGGAGLIWPESGFAQSNYFADVIYEEPSNAAPYRMWLTNAAADYTPPTIRGSWHDATITMARRMGRRPEGAAATSARAEASATNNYNVLLGRWVSPPALRAGTLAGVMNWAVGVLESDAAMNAYFRWHVYVTVGDTDVVRGVLRSEIVNTTEWISSGAVGRTGNNWDMTSTAIQAGDRIVVELGYQAQNTSTTSYTGTIHYGGTGDTDLSLASANVTTEPGWVEFTGAPGLFWDPTADATDHFADGSIDSTLWPVTFGSPTETGSRLRIPTTNACAGVESRPSLALQGSFAHARLLTLPAASTATTARAEFGVRARAGQAIWRYDAVSGNLQARLDRCVVSDTFTRTVGDGWQAADTGQTYTVTAGPAADIATTGGRGRMTITAVGSRQVALDAEGTNLDVYIDRLAFSALPTGANMEYGVRLRAVDSANFCEARIFATTGNAVTVQVRQRVAGVETGSAFVGVTGATATSALSLRAQVTGTTLRIRGWLNGSAEPGTWTASMTTTLTPAGGILITGGRNSGNTNTNPHIEIDGLAISDLDGTDTPTSIAYSSTNHRWLRVREGTAGGGSAGTVYWDTSSDGVTWTNRRSAVSPAWARFKDSAIVMRSWRDAGTGDFTEFDSINTGVDWVTDTAPIADSVTATRRRSFAAADTAPIADAVTARLVRARAVTDTAPITDAVAAAEAKLRTVADLVPAADATTASQVHPRAVADDAPIVDAAAVAEVKVRGHADTVASVDSVSVVSTRPRVVADTVPVTDTTVPAVSRARAVADTAPITDAVAAAEARLRTVADTVAIVDEVTAEKLGPREVDDVAAITDSVTARLDRVQEVADTTPVVDVVDRARSATAAVADTVPVADTLAAAVANLVAVGDLVGAADTASPVRAVARQPVDAAAIVDDASAVVLRPRTVADTAPVGDATDRAVTRSRGAADTAVIADAVTARLGVSAAPADEVPVVDAAVRAVTWARAADETVAVADATSVVEVKPRSVADTAPVVDQVTALLGFFFALVDAAPVSDQVTITVARPRPVTDTVAADDVAATAVVRLRAVTDTAPISDAVIVLLSLQVAVGDAVAVADSASVRLARHVAVGDGVGIVGQDFPVLNRGQLGPSQTVTVPIVVAAQTVPALPGTQAVPVGAADTYVPISSGRRIVPVTYQQGGGS